MPNDWSFACALFGGTVWMLVQHAVSVCARVTEGKEYPTNVVKTTRCMIVRDSLVRIVHRPNSEDRMDLAKIGRHALRCDRMRLIEEANARDLHEGPRDH